LFTSSRDLGFIIDELFDLKEVIFGWKVILYVILDLIIIIA